MKNKRYRIRLWINEKHFAEWSISAEDNQDAQSRCDYLKGCCLKYGGWSPLRADIKLV